MQRILTGISEYLFHMYDELLKELKQTEGYRNDSRAAETIEDKYPVIRHILEGDHIKKECRLSEEVQAAIKEYVELRVNMQEDLQMAYYMRGFHDCFLLLLKCRILNGL